MRISLLSINLSAPDSPAPGNRIDRLAQFVAERNVTCIFLQGCGQPNTPPSNAPKPPIAEGNCALRLQSTLNTIGIRYELVWHGVPTPDGVFTDGCAVLSQLPVLDHAADNGTHAQTNQSAMARIAVGPDTVLDCYTVVLGSGEISASEGAQRLLSFVERTPSLLAEKQPDRPRKRGPVPRRQKAAADAVQTRIICIGASVPSGSDPLEPRDLEAFSGAHYFDLTREVRNSDPSAATTDAGWNDHLFVKPAIRPLSTKLLFSGTDRPRLGDHAAVFAEIEL